MQCNDLINISTVLPLNDNHSNTSLIPSIKSQQKCSTPRESKDFDAELNTSEVDDIDLSCDLLRSSLINLENETTLDDNDNVEFNINPTKITTTTTSNRQINKNLSDCLIDFNDNCDLLLYDTLATTNKSNTSLNGKPLETNFDIDSLSQSKFANELNNCKVSAHSQLQQQQRKNDIEKEILKREHCEKQIQILNKKLLDVEEQLAVLNATDKKKEILIDKLKKTLNKVVENWKKKEEDMSKIVRKLSQDKQMALSNESNCINRVKFLEDEMRQLNHELHSERTKFQEYSNEKSIELNRLKKEYTELQKNDLEKTSQLEELQNKITLFRDEKDSLKQKIINLEAKLEDDRVKFIEKEEEYLEQINNLASSNEKLNEKHNSMKLEYEELIKEAKNVVQQSEIQYKQLIDNIEAEKRAKDGLQVQYNVLEEKLEQSLIELKQENEQNIKRIQMDNLEKEQKLIEKHTRCLNDLNLKHQDNMNDLQIKYKHEYESKINDYEIKLNFLTNKINLLQNEINNLNETNKILENDRNSIRQNLKQKLENQMQEVMQLIGLSSNLNSENFIQDSNESNLSKASTFHPNLDYSAFKAYDQNINKTLERTHLSTNNQDIDETQNDYFIKYQLDRINKCYEINTDTLLPKEVHQNEPLSARTKDKSVSEKSLNSSRVGELRYFIEMLLDRSPTDSTSTKIEPLKHQEINESPIRDTTKTPIKLSTNSGRYSYNSESEPDEESSYYRNGSQRTKNDSFIKNRIFKRNSECFDEVKRNLDLDFESLTPPKPLPIIHKPQKTSDMPIKSIKKPETTKHGQKSLPNSTKSSISASNLVSKDQQNVAKQPQKVVTKRVWK